ncbi:hypothetical protein DFQ28_002135 [Apophysomyces sp. BC1034]|nr:hypothetical protein DFQ30_002538 [Apophysomyces sp. BC1015]KAG0179818.1 hypothetical protein DFQ29_001627 [Apophysomyces sp. BC1021]KAG0190391.1 hypothetical protein DFQ28_002135 [Apophysomyces sp. BC1034]
MVHPGVVVPIVIVGTVILAYGVYEVLHSQNATPSRNYASPPNEKHDDSDNDDSDNQDPKSKTTGFKKTNGTIHKRSNRRQSEDEEYELEERERSIFARRLRLEEEERNLRIEESQMEERRERLERLRSMQNELANRVHANTDELEQAEQHTENPFDDHSASVHTSTHSSATEIPSILPPARTPEPSVEVNNEINPSKLSPLGLQPQQEDNLQNPFEGHSASVSTSFHSIATDISPISSPAHSPESSVELSNERHMPTDAQPQHNEQDLEDSLSQLRPEAEFVADEDGDTDEESSQTFQSSMQFPCASTEGSDSEESWAEIDRLSAGSPGHRSRAQSDVSDVNDLSSSSLRTPRAPRSDDGSSYDVLSMSEGEEHEHS